MLREGPRADDWWARVRIIAGSLKGRRLASPSWPGLRPTSDRLRETLFDVIADRVRGARVLDGYAGTGAVGIEALSRGAAHVTFVDRDERALRLVSENLRRCGIADRYAIMRSRVADVPRVLPSDSFDLVVLDPPYDEPDVAATVIAAAGLVEAGGWLVLEHARRRPAPEAAGVLARVRDLRAGDSALAFYARRDERPGRRAGVDEA
jgi:16S rRNA (guanine966-N2)-methyltransferase